MARRTPAVMRALDILELFMDGHDVALSPADVGVQTDLPRTSVHELLTTLASRGYLDRDDAGRYRLGVRLLQLGHAYTSQFDLLRTASELARTVAFETGETCSVATLQGSEVFYLSKVDGQEPLPLSSGVGKRLPASCTGLGKALLAGLTSEQLHALYPDRVLPVMTPHSLRAFDDLELELTAVRAMGCAFEREESTMGTACAAAPIRDVTGQIVAAISVALPLERWDASPRSRWVSVVQDAAAGLSASLGHVESLGA